MNASEEYQHQFWKWFMLIVFQFFIKNPAFIFNYFIKWLHETICILLCHSYNWYDLYLSRYMLKVFNNICVITNIMAYHWFDYFWSKTEKMNSGLCLSEVFNHILTLCGWYGSQVTFAFNCWRMMYFQIYNSIYHSRFFFQRKREWCC